MRAILYASAIGSIMYAMLWMHSDVSYALSATSRYQSNCGEAHWTIIKNILKYLRRTKEAFLVFGGEEDLIVKGTTMLVSKQMQMILNHNPVLCSISMEGW
jgi:tRNA C32,U32 (ribose-2'-O)-methylase TrmJ